MSIVTGKLPRCDEPVDLEPAAKQPGPGTVVLKTSAPAQPPKFKRPRPAMPRAVVRK